MNFQETRILKDHPEFFPNPDFNLAVSSTVPTIMNIT